VLCATLLCPVLQVKGAGLQEEQIAYICAESLKVRPCTGTCVCLFFTPVCVYACSCMVAKMQVLAPWFTLTLGVSRLRIRVAAAVLAQQKSGCTSMECRG
jgi:hypothetical protein